MHILNTRVTIEDPRKKRRSCSVKDANSMVTQKTTVYAHLDVLNVRKGIKQQTALRKIVPLRPNVHYALKNTLRTTKDVKYTGKSKKEKIPQL